MSFELTISSFDRNGTQVFTAFEGITPDYIIDKLGYVPSSVVVVRGNRKLKDSEIITVDTSLHIQQYSREAKLMSATPKERIIYIAIILVLLCILFMMPSKSHASEGLTSVHNTMVRHMINNSSCSSDIVEVLLPGATLGTYNKAVAIYKECSLKDRKIKALYLQKACFTQQWTMALAADFGQRWADGTAPINSRKARRELIAERCPTIDPLTFPLY